jgi:hypothetical protein
MNTGKVPFLGALLLGVSYQAFGQELPSAPEPCAYDKAAMLALSESDFDQSPNGGWRVIAQNEECFIVAADLIDEYRTAHASDSSILYWHEGQLRAMAGYDAEAVALFEKSRSQSDAGSFGWDHYVAATIAFLEKDKGALQEARELLSRVEKPQNIRPPVDPDGNPIEFSWPPNLDVVDRLIACFDKTYKVAYAGCSQ